MGLAILFLVALLLLIAIGWAALVRALTRPRRRTAGPALAAGLPTDPAEAGLPYEIHTLETFDGVEIDLWLVEGAARDAPAVVMLHGFADSRWGEMRWLHVLRPLCSHMLLFDQRAHGESHHTRFTWGAAEVRDTATILQWLRRRTDRPIVLLGCSMGAAIAIATAAGPAGKDVAAVIADSPYRYASQAVTRVLRAQGLPTWPLAPLALGWLAWRGWNKVNRDVAAIASDLPQPLLVIHGRRDPLVSIDEAQAIAAAPSAQLHLVDDACHADAACLDPIGYRQRVATFLGEVSPRS